MENLKTRVLLIAIALFLATLTASAITPRDILVKYSKMSDSNIVDLISGTNKHCKDVKEIKSMKVISIKDNAKKIFDEIKSDLNALSKDDDEIRVRNNGEDGSSFVIMKCDSKNKIKTIFVVSYNFDGCSLVYIEGDINMGTFNYGTPFA